jgi:hypothetical protein
VLGSGHRSGRIGVLARAAGHIERQSGLPGWVALPALIATASLITAVFGMYWDISLHIDNGRDPGPLANPAHYFILLGLFGIFTAGFIAIVLPTERPSGSAVRLTGDWHAPLGGVLICACGAFSLIGFPLDDVWHRLFGQDVTLWGPTHLMLIGGAAMTLVGIAVLVVEGLRANRDQGVPDRAKPWTRSMIAVALTGGFMLGFSTFQGEFDFGVAQFRLVFHPILLMLAAGVGLVTARMWAGRGAALGAAAFFVAVRALLALAVGPILGQTTPHFPLYIVEALVVEAVALLIAPSRRPLRFAVVSGVGIGTSGLAAEWAWSHVWMPLPWPRALFPEAAVLGFVAAIAGSLLAAWISVRLSVEPRSHGRRSLRAAAITGALLTACSVAWALPKPSDDGVRADVALTNVRSGADRMVDATVSITPHAAAEHAGWLDVTAWQGGGFVLSRLDRTAPGIYRTTKPIPVHGKWKALIRLHKGRSLAAAPIYLPADPAIPAPSVPATARFARPFVADHHILQREQKAAAPALTAIAYTVVGSIALVLLVLLAWGLHRLSRSASAPAERPNTAPARRTRPVELASSHA